MKVSIVGVPVYYGSDREGAEKGPLKLREYKLEDCIKKYFDTKDYGDIDVLENKEENHRKNNIKYYDTILDYSQKLAKQVDEIKSKGEFPFTIGGDHSLAIGSVSAISKDDDIAVIWIDAHADINIASESTSGNAHGMPLSFLFNLEENELNNVLYKGPKFKIENLYEIGQRSVDPAEQATIDEKNIKLWSVDEYRKEGLEKVLNKVIDDIKSKGIDKVHISFDIDFVDKDLVPGTGTPVENGASREEALYVLEKLASSGLIKSMDFVELNPKRDIDDMTAKISYELIEHFFKNLK